MKNNPCAKMEKNDYTPTYIQHSFSVKKISEFLVHFFQKTLPLVYRSSLKQEEILKVEILIHVS